MIRDNGLPYYKAYPRDFVEGTMGMSFEEKGAYRILLDLIYMRRGRLEDDPRYIAGVLACSVRKWSSIRNRLIQSGKITVIDGFIRNHRADTEVESLAKLSDKQRENGSGSRKSKGLQKPWLRQPEPESEPEVRKVKPPPPPPQPRAEPVASSGPAENAGEPKEATLRDSILLACGADPVSGLTGPTGSVLGSRADMHAVERWRSDLGLDDDAILAVIRDAMSRKRDGPPSRLTYFDRPMQREAAIRNQPKLEPSHAITGHSEFPVAAGAPARPGSGGSPSGLVGVAMRRAAARRAEVEGEA